MTRETRPPRGHSAFAIGLAADRCFSPQEYIAESQN